MSVVMKEHQHIALVFQLAGESGKRKFSGFLRYASEKKRDWRMQFIRLKEDFSAEFVRSLATRKIDGIAYSLSPAKDAESELAKLSIPTIAIDIFDERRLGGRRKNISFFTCSSDEIGRTAARHLMSLGTCRSYAFVPDLHWHTWSKLRGIAFRQEIQGNNLPVAIYRMRGKGYDLSQLADWLKRLPRPIGVFAAFDDRAVQVLEACREARLSVPGDVAVISVDNDELLCNHTTPTLTSIQPDHELLGYLAAQQLDKMMNSPPSNRPEHREVGVKSVVIRESTGEVSLAGRLVQKALGFIRLHLGEPILPRDVVAHLGVSRRLADLRFRELQGESIGEAILRIKIEEASRLFRETRASPAAIAHACGFKHLSRMRTAFKSVYGVFPEEANFRQA